MSERSKRERGKREERADMNRGNIYMYLETLSRRDTMFFRVLFAVILSRYS